MASNWDPKNSGTRQRWLNGGDSAIRVRLRSPLVFLIILAAAILQLAYPQKIWVVLMVGFLGIGLLSAAWTFSLVRGLVLIREKRFGWAHVGDRIEERFTLTNAGWFPALWVEVRDHSTMRDYHPGVVTGIGGLSENRWSSKSVCLHRGVYRLGPTGIVCGDPFGVFTAEREYASSSTFVVMPAVVPLPEIEIAHGGRAGEGRPRADAIERTVSSAGVRPYQPGDSLRWIHWPTSARKDSLFVRLFDGTPAADWWIFLDLCSDCQAGDGENSTLEHSVVLAASMAQRGVLEDHAVGLVAHDSRRLFWHMPGEGSAHFWEIMRSLAVVSAGPRSMGELLAQLSPRQCERSSLIIITADIREGWLNQLLRAVQRGAHPTVLLLNPQSYGGMTPSRSLCSTLVDLNIPVFSIERELLNQTVWRPRDESQPDIRVTPTGGVVVVRSGKDPAWKTLE